MSSSSCSVKLSTIVDNKIGIVPNKENSAIIYEFYNYMQEKGSSDNHQVNNLKVVINFANFLGPNITFYNISKKEQILSFLKTKIKEHINLSKFTFRENIDENIPETMTVQNIYNPNLLYGIVEFIRHNNKYLHIDYAFPPRRDERGQHLSDLIYYKLYFISQTNENERLFIALGSSENVTNLKSKMEILLNSNELKPFVEQYYNIIDEINNNENLYKFNENISNTCLQLTAKNEKLKGKCDECPSWLDYF
jgi:hypothetical protein